MYSVNSERKINRQLVAKITKSKRAKSRVGERDERLTHVHVERYLLDSSADLFRDQREQGEEENETSVRMLLSAEISSSAPFPLA